MNKTDKDLLLRLGAGDSIQAICDDAGLTRAEFDQWWADQTTERVPSTEGTRTASDLSGKVEIARDEWGVPHILAETDDDLFFGYGYATAQDRLWQLDYYRRKARGRLSEVIGPSGIEIDTVSHTIGLERTAQENLARFPEKTKRRLQAYTDGVNAFMEETRSSLPIEFDLLGYEPQGWTPLDSVATWQEFRWYLTGRLPIIAIPDLAKRTLGEGALLDDFITGEAEDESIVPKGSYSPSRTGEVPVGEVVGDPDEGIGSNNWVVSGSKSTSGAPMVASDPHIAFGAVSCWYEVHLSGPDINVAGAGYVGVPGVVFGRNETLAWGVTNNICSQRDIYREQEDPDRPGHFRFGDEWRPAKNETVEIAVKGEDARTITITRTHNGPIVDELLPEPLRTTDKVSARWLGTGFGDEITCMLDLAAAGNCDEAKEALRDWIVPTWSYVFGDVEGHIGYQAVGRIPIREQWNREYRPGWDPAHQWSGLIPYDALPALSDPAEGYARSANNRTAPEDYPYPLSGTWSSGHRALRIRQMLEEQEQFSREDFARMQTDTLSMRAVEVLPSLVETLKRSSDPRVLEAAGFLDEWNGRMDVDEVGASIFELFFAEFTTAVAAERFSGDEVPLVAGAISGYSVRLLRKDETGGSPPRNETVVTSMLRAIDILTERLGPEMAEWRWGRIHKIALNHLLSDRGDLSDLLKRGGQPVGGNGITVCNTGFDPNYLASIGANWRHNADLADDPPGLWAVDTTGQSGHPGSPHYGDQLTEWLAGRHHYLPLDSERARAQAASTLTLSPG
ncbi:MAG: penicillin acylase family protein [Dehalococcoidia bacterium]|nr:penicillin acylase family protein [Dehalococcoidia bacterium]